MTRNQSAALGGFMGLLLMAVVVIAMGAPVITLFPMVAAVLLLLWAGSRQGEVEQAD